MLYFSQLEKVTPGKLLRLSADQEIEHLLYDSRKLIISKSSLFFAITSQRNNGHKYIPELYHKGIRQFIVEKGNVLSISEFSDANFFEVASSIEALQHIASHHRKSFVIPVLGITGSNGKTIIKEWLSQLLVPDYSVIKNPRSFNSQLGVPLSVWQINGNHDFGIFEAGISQPGEMAKIEQIIMPEIGIFTNIGTAHDEGFGSRTEKIKEKLRLFVNSSSLIYCSDHKEVRQAVEDFLPEISSYCWSRYDRSAYVFIENTEKREHGILLSYVINNEKLSVLMPFWDEASVENATHCLVLMHFLGFGNRTINHRLRLLEKVPMRLELKQGINNCYIIDDTYNNDLAGLSMAVHFLVNQHQKDRKTLILSDILESGTDKECLYRNVASVLFDKKINRVIGVGPDISSFGYFFEDFVSFPSTAEFIENFNANNFSDEIILVKGARMFHFEEIINLLQYKTHGTILEINLDALSHNLNFYRSLLKPETKVMGMVKAFAYGSGSYETANLLQFHHVDYVAVAYADEGVDLRRNGIYLPIMVMNPSPETFDLLLKFNLEPEIYNFYILNQFLVYLKSHEQKSRIHIKLDTGMKRLGFEEEDVSQLSQFIQDNKDYLEPVSVFSHLAAADDCQHNEFTYSQIEKFNNMAKALESNWGKTLIKHISNSAGVVRFPEAQMDMIRLGIGLYGVETNNISQAKLKTVATLKTIISQIKTVEKGETVGYGRWGKAEADIKIATIAIGYADGYDRRFSKGVGEVMINGRLCPVIGNVCMDMSMVNITGVDAKEGDEVIIFGDNPDIIKLANKIGTIPYEILTGVGERVKRVFYTE
ncbi:MAG: bifunctional UDP-N-acetylmuramoyl-tripeptide:D-alanyl-D-alanine ligase/alanine racemase [Cytophagaceae bacterium]